MLKNIYEALMYVSSSIPSQICRVEGKETEDSLNLKLYIQLSDKNFHLFYEETHLAKTEVPSV